MEEQYNPDLWNSDLNDALYKAVIERVFDFSLIALDIRDYIIMSGIDKDFELYTRDQCRLHWSYIHALREDVIKKMETKEEAAAAEPPPVEKKHAVLIEKQEPDFSKVRTTTIEGKVITPSSILIKCLKYSNSV